MCLEIRRELFPEEPGGHHDVIGAAQPLQHEVAQAAAHRITDEQRTSEHGDRGGDAGDDGEVDPPVIGEAANDEAAEGHQVCGASGCANRRRRAAHPRRQ